LIALQLTAVPSWTFAKGHGGLATLVQSHLQKKPLDGAVYVFRAKRADRLKMIPLSCM